jgi:hypothetical protein
VEDDPIEFYSFETENGAEGTKGFVLVCNDNRIGHILAIIDEGIPDDPESPFYENFYGRLTPYVDRIIEEYDGISGEEVRRVLDRVDAKGEDTGRWLDYTYQEMVDHYVIEEEQSYDGDGYSYTPDSSQGTGFYHREGYVDNVYWAGWQWTDGHYATVPVQWKQEGGFSSAVNAAHGQPWGSSMYKAGCGPVAVAQIMAYHEYPEYSTYTYNNMAFFFWGVSPVYSFIITSLIQSGIIGI